METKLLSQYISWKAKVQSWKLLCMRRNTCMWCMVQGQLHGPRKLFSVSIYCTNPTVGHRHLQSCVGTWQDLATPHLMRNCGSVIVTKLYAIRTSVRAYKHGYAGLRACRMSSRPVIGYECAMLQNNPGNALGMPGPAGGYAVGFLCHFNMQASCNLYEN